jgi:putative transposase
VQRQANTKAKVSIAVATDLLGFSRQAYYKGLSRNPLPESFPDEQLKMLVARARLDCPGKGCRSIYKDHASELSIGRDKAELLMRDLGLNIRKASKYIRTTESGRRVFGNLLVGLELRAVNKVWQCDMTYYIHLRKTYYIMMITDVYSQSIVGYGAYERAFSSNFQAVLHQAIKQRKKAGYELTGLIHHSDGGKQYEAKNYMALCTQMNIRQSMGRYSWENPYAEKTNDLIKNRYLAFWKPADLISLRRCLKSAVENHNAFQSKRVLGNLSPLDFEKSCLQNNQVISPYVLTLRPTHPTSKNKLLNLSIT